LLDELLPRNDVIAELIDNDDDGEEEEEDDDDEDYNVSGSSDEGSDWDDLFAEAEELELERQSEDIGLLQQRSRAPGGSDGESESPEEDH